MSARSVRVYVASLDTRAATELCIRSMRRTAGHPFELTVGDGGSTDGTSEMLAGLERAGWLTVERAPGGRTHAEWLERWRRRAEADLVVFSDSDVQYRRPGWLARMVAAAGPGVAMVAAEEVPESPGYVEPVGHRTVRAASRPSPWLLLVVPELANRAEAGFAFDKEETDRVPEGMIVYDVGGRLQRELEQAGLEVAVMPPDFRSMYVHHGGLSWVPLRGRRGLIKLRSLARVRVGLWWLRLRDRLDGEPRGQRAQPDPPNRRHC